MSEAEKIVAMAQELDDLREAFIALGQSQDALIELGAEHDQDIALLKKAIAQPEQGNTAVKKLLAYKETLQPTSPAVAVVDSCIQILYN